MMKGEIAALNKDFCERHRHFRPVDQRRAAFFPGALPERVFPPGQRRIQVAKTSLAKAVELNPKYVKARMLLAEMAMRDRDFERAQRRAPRNSGVESKRLSSQNDAG
jgi:hypothetical protein